MKLNAIAGSLVGKSREQVLIRDWISCESKVRSSHVHNFAHLTGDTNPIHLNHVEAKAVGFSQPIAHGMLVASLIPTLLAYALPGAVYLSQTLKFKMPVFHEENIKALIEVKQIREFKRRRKEESGETPALLLVCNTIVFKPNSVEAWVPSVEGEGHVLV